MEPENDDFQESPSSGFHVKQPPQNPKNHPWNFPKNPPLPSGCCDFFSSSLVFCNLKKRHRHVAVQLPFHFFVVEGLLWTGHDFPSTLEKHNDFRTFPLRNLVAFWELDGDSVTSLQNSRVFDPNTSVPEKWGPKSCQLPWQNRQKQIRWKINDFHDFLGTKWWYLLCFCLGNSCLLFQ